MDAFPAYFPLKGKRVVIAGTGEAADAKARLFEGSPARVVRIDAPEAFTPSGYADAVLAFIAGDEMFCQVASEAAGKAGVIVNVVDKPKLSDFHIPAIIDRGEVVAAVGTASASPLLSAMLRSDVEARVPEGVGQIAVLMNQHQIPIRKALPEQGRRRAFLREVMSGPIAEAAKDGDLERAGQMLLSELAGGFTPKGRVLFIAGRGPVDLLTIRAGRALAAADILAADLDADPQILALARGDIPRLPAEEADAARLTVLAREGKQVARVITRPVDTTELRALAAAKIAVEVMLAAPVA